MGPVSDHLQRTACASSQCVRSALRTTYPRISEVSINERRDMTQTQRYRRTTTHNQ